MKTLHPPPSWIPLVGLTVVFGTMCSGEFSAAHAAPKKTMPRLEQALRSSHPKVQRNAINKVGAMGRRGLFAVSALISLRKARSRNIRQRIAWALGQITSGALHHPRTRRLTPIQKQALRRRKIRKMLEKATIVGVIGVKKPTLHRCEVYWEHTVHKSTSGDLDDALSRYLQQKQEKKRTCNKSSPTSKLMFLLRRGNMEQKRVSLSCLEKKGAGAYRAVPLLLGLLGGASTEIQKRSVDVLAAIGRKAFPGLKEVLRNAKGRHREGAILALEKMKHQGPAVSRMLWDSMLLPEECARFYARRGLKRSQRRALPLFIRGIRHKNPEIRLFSMEQLSKYKGSYISKMALLQTLRDVEPRVRAIALQMFGERSLRRKKTPSKEVIRVLSQGLYDKESIVRLQAIESLTHFRGYNSSAIPKLGKLLLSVKSPKMASAIVSCLATMGTAGLAVLEKGLGHKNAVVRRASVFGLSQSGGLSLAVFKRALQRSGADVRKHISEVLASMNTPAARVFPLLVIAAKDTDKSVRVSAISGLCQRGGLSALLQLFEQVGFKKRVDLLKSFGRIFACHSPTVFPLIQRGGKDLAKEVRLATLEALVEMNAGTLPTSNEVLRALGDTEQKIRERAMKQFRKKYPHGLSIFVHLLSDDSRKIRRRALVALESFVPASVAATLTLFLMCKDPAPQVKQTASRALLQMTLKSLNITSTTCQFCIQIRKIQIKKKQLKTHIPGTWSTMRVRQFLHRSKTKGSVKSRRFVGTLLRFLGWHQKG